jgi:CRP-like cAMP-binding protein
MFKGWTLTALNKLLSHVETKSFIGKQIILSEGQKANKFHIVLEGEIELFRRVVVKEHKEIDAQEYKREPKDKNFKALYHLMKRKESEVVTKSNTISIRYIRVGKLFGIEDFLSSDPNRKY